jgi:hypothetical protein
MSEVSDHGNTEVLHSVGKRRFLLAGQFAPNGTGAIATPTLFTAGWSVARTSAGVFTVTLLDFWLKITPLSVVLTTVTVQDLVLQPTSVGLGTNTIGQTVVQPTVVFTCFVPGGTTATDITAATTTFITFTLLLSLDTVQG